MCRTLPGGLRPWKLSILALCHGVIIRLIRAIIYINMACIFTLITPISFPEQKITPIQSLKKVPIGADYLAFNWGMRAAFSVAPNMCWRWCCRYH